MGIDKKDFMMKITALVNFFSTSFYDQNIIFKQCILFLVFSVW
jgi:hypothetical protein